MFRAVSLLTTLLFATSIVASPLEVRDTLITLPFAKHFNASGGAMYRRSGVVNVSAFNAVFSYIVAVGVGIPQTTYNLLIDTGSANTVLGTTITYKPTKTSHNTGKRVRLHYDITAGGLLEGTEWLDTLTLPKTSFSQSLCVASQEPHPRPFSNGILGLGPASQTRGTLVDFPQEIIPTVTDNLCAKGSNLVSISFQPTNTEPLTANGELTFCGTDASKFISPLNYFPVTVTHPSSEYWGIDQSISYGDQQIMPLSAGVVDTGATFISLPTAAYNKYKAATGGTYDGTTRLLKLTLQQYGKLKDLHFNIHGTTYTLIPNGQIWPRALNHYIGGMSDGIYLIVDDMGAGAAPGFQFINGQVFLERFYSVYDSGTSTGIRRVGLAKTPYTNSQIN